VPARRGQPAGQQSKRAKDQDLGQVHLETLVNPLRRFVCCKDQDGDQDQAEQQRIQVFTRKDLMQHTRVYLYPHIRHSPASWTTL
jgi:hypothetical protein